MKSLDLIRGASFFLILVVSFGCSASQQNSAPGNASSNGATANATSNATSNAVSNAPSNAQAGGAYPESVADEFVNSCVEAGSEENFCLCVFAKVQARYTLEEFSIIEAKLTAGTPPEEFVEFSGKARAECLQNK